MVNYSPLFRRTGRKSMPVNSTKISGLLALNATSFMTGQISFWNSLLMEKGSKPSIVMNALIALMAMKGDSSN